MNVFEFPKGLPDYAYAKKGGGKRGKKNSLVDQFVNAHRTELKNIFLDDQQLIDILNREVGSDQHKNEPLINKMLCLPSARTVLREVNMLTFEKFVIKESMKLVIQWVGSERDPELTEVLQSGAFNNADLVKIMIFNDAYYAVHDEFPDYSWLMSFLMFYKVLDHFDQIIDELLKNRVAMALFAIASELGQVLMLSECLDRCPDLERYWEGIDLDQVPRAIPEDLLSVYAMYSDTLSSVYEQYKEKVKDAGILQDAPQNPFELNDYCLSWQEKHTDAVIIEMRNIAIENQINEARMVDELAKKNKTAINKIKQWTKQYTLLKTDDEQALYEDVIGKLDQIMVLRKLSSVSEGIRCRILSVYLFTLSIEGSFMHFEREVKSLSQRIAEAGGNLSIITSTTKEIQTLEAQQHGVIIKLLMMISEACKLEHLNEFDKALHALNEEYYSPTTPFDWNARSTVDNEEPNLLALQAAEATEKVQTLIGEKRDIIDENRELRARLATLENDLVNTQAELKVIKGKMYEVENNKNEKLVKEVNALSGVDTASIVEACLLGSPPPHQVLTWLGNVYADKLVILPTAFEGAGNNPLFKNTRRLYEVIKILVEQYLPQTLSGKPDSETKNLFADAFRARESNTVANNATLRAEREFNYKGEVHYFKKHLAIGVGQGKNESLRIYFMVDRDEGKIVVADCGEHKRTARSI